jgi:hypothetical protein
MIDQPGKLYLGRDFDIATQQTSSDSFLLSARDLTTHAVCLGMTGTGKTGLGICVLEEALLQDIPCIILDPKGDITNLVLSFPNFAAADFEPWLDEDEAQRQKVTLRELASKTAQRWRAGLQSWGIDDERVSRLQDRAAFQIYTPGSDAGIAVNILQNFNPPSTENLSWQRNAESLRERIAQITSALLELVGIQADPMQSREHILLATIFESAWRAGQNVDIGALIAMVQTPPVRKVGAFDMDVFYPKQERFQLAMALNNLSASPSFRSWQSGVALDVNELVKRLPGGANPAGKTRANIFYLAHLGDEERQFFVTLLLSQLVLWMRAQSGTSALRCLIYFDEVFGYCPPFPRNPPTKAPIMTIIKQGRAAGVGLFLATQNPADLDYKGLSNIGTWFIGRLRTGRDRDRALEGLEGAAAGLDRATFEKPLSTLPQRVFLAQSATGEPRFLHTRWAMSFLRGPLTRDQVTKLAGVREKGNEEWGVESSDERLETKDLAYDQSQISSLQPQSHLRPQLPPDVREVFLASALNPPPSAVYRPHLLASASVRITDRSSGVAQDERYTFLLPLGSADVLHTPNFAQAQQLGNLNPAQLQLQPNAGVGFDGLPAGLTSRWMKQCEKALVEHIYRNGVKQILFNRTLKLYGAVDESALEFRQRCEAAAREKRNQEALKVRDKFERRMEALQGQLLRQHRELEGERLELSGRKREELLTNAESVLNFVLGRRDNRMMSWGAWKRRQTQAAAQDVQDTEQAIAKLNLDLQQVATEYQTALSQISEKWARVVSDVQDVPLAPKKSDIFADLVAVAWVA